MIKQKSSRATRTPGSGEALLRGQVKTLLQKVEEEADLSKLSFESRPFVHLKGIVNSPAGLLAPTPANTPQVLNLSDDRSLNPNTGFASQAPSPLADSQLIPQTVDGEDQNNLESHKCIITRSLLLDFSEKSDSNDPSECSSELTFSSGEAEIKEKSTLDDDNASIWSVQVNASTHGEDDDEDEIVDEEEEEGDCYYNEEEEDEIEDDGGDELINALCECINNISMNDKQLPKFEGKHTRFVYNSDDEIEGEESSETQQSGGASPNVVRLKGLPTPKGKHLRFVEEEERN